MPAYKEITVRRKGQREGETDEEYLIRRDNNNKAVTKSRTEKKQKMKETEQLVDTLRMKNSLLEGKITTYRKELRDLKEVLEVHSGLGNVNLNIDFVALLKDPL